MPYGARESGDLTNQQRRAAELIAQGIALGKVAARVRVDEKTLWRWRQRDDFREAVDESFSEAMLTLRRGFIANSQLGMQHLADVVEGEIEATPAQQHDAAAKLAQIGARIMLSKDAAEAAVVAARPEAVTIEFGVDPKAVDAEVCSDDPGRGAGDDDGHGDTEAAD